MTNLQRIVEAPGWHLAFPAGHQRLTDGVAKVLIGISIWQTPSDRYRLALHSIGFGDIGHDGTTAPAEDLAISALCP